MPKVVEYARAHFGCPTLEGVELENEGSEMSRGSHWERRILGDEVKQSDIHVKLNSLYSS